MSGWEENEVSKNSQGGTEITKRTLQSVIDPILLENFQIIPSRIRELKSDKIRVLHLHDTPDDPEMQKLKDESLRNQFHKFIFSSNWQMDKFAMYFGLPYDDKLLVLETPIEPLPIHEKPNDQINLVYFSTPQRGLELLIPVFEELVKHHDNVHLHIHSSFLIYGWEDMDKNFESLYTRIRNHPKMTYHGATSQQDLRKALESYHILAYPNIWPETSCRVLMESMSAGLLCIHPNLGALADTAGGLTSMYQFLSDPNKHANLFYQFLDHAVKVVQLDDVKQYLRFVKAYVDNRFQLAKISSQWEVALKDLLIRYPDESSRAFPARQFVYRTS